MGGLEETLHLLHGEFEQIATKISPKKSGVTLLSVKKIFTDSRGNRQANWNLAIFFRILKCAPLCNLPPLCDCKSSAQLCCKPKKLLKFTNNDEKNTVLLSHIFLLTILSPCM